MDFERTFEAFRELEITGSTIGKMTILSKYADLQPFRDLLVDTYNPFVVYNIRKLEDLAIPIHEGGSLENNYRRFRELLRLLSKRIVTGDAARSKVRDVFSQFNPSEYKWYGRVLTRDLNVGIQKKTINSVIPDLIPTFDVMLAKPISKYPSEFILQPKLDGMRIVVNTTTGQMFSRNGKEVLGYDTISEEAKKLPGGLWIDGEIMSGTKFNSTMTQAFRHSSSKEGILNAFDIITHEEFESGKGREQLYIRDFVLGAQLSGLNLTSIVKVPSSPIISTREHNWLDRATEFYESYLSQGYEGAMVKDVESVYESKRSKSWQKLKPENDYSVKVIGIEPGKHDTKYEEQVGKLVCDFNGEEVRVGSGLSDEQRLQWWLDQTKIVGKIIDITGQEITDNKKGTHSIRFPRYKRIRIDLD
jgi:DNA ligase-1